MADPAAEEVPVAELVKRLRPSFNADLVFSHAVSRLREGGMNYLAAQLNEALIERNGLQSEAASALESLAVKLSAAERAAVTAAIPLEAMRMVGNERGWYSDAIWQGVIEGSDAVRAMLAARALNPKEDHP